MRDFRDVKVWGKAGSLTTDVYRASASFPKSETYGLTHQVRSAAVSVAANIAEGCGRSSSAELRRFFEMASGSASELEARAGRRGEEDADGVHRTHSRGRVREQSLTAES